MMVESSKKDGLNYEDDGSEDDDDDEEEDDEDDIEESSRSSRSRARSRSNSPSQSKEKVLFITSFGDEDEEEEPPKVATTLKKSQPADPPNIPTCEFKPDLYDACINAKLLKENVTTRSRSQSPTKLQKKCV